MDVNGKQVVVLGLGISGMEAAKLLQDNGANVTVHDNATTGKVVERAAVLRERGVKVELGPEIRTESRFSFGVLSPGINPKTPLVETLHQAGLPMFGELELAYRFCVCPIVAITGTNGKTTTTELIQGGAQRKGGKKLRWASCWEISGPLFHRRCARAPISMSWCSRSARSSSRTSSISVRA